MFFREQALKLLRLRAAGHTILFSALMAGLVSCAGARGRQSDGNADTTQSLAPGNYSFELEHGGRTREFLVRVPPAIQNGAPLALVLALHGGGGNAIQFRDGAGLDAVADREGFMAVYPHGTGRLRRRLLTWNSGTCCGYAATEGVDDVGFLIAVIDDLAHRTPIDRDRIYVTGHSNGGMMSHRLAAEASELIAAAAPVAGGLVLEEFSPTRPVPILQIHSEDDPRALYLGGLGPPFPLTDSRVMHPSIPKTLALWTNRNGCADSPIIVDEREGQRGTRTAGHSAERLVWSCSGGAPVEHWRLHGVGHGWPGELLPRIRETIIGTTTDLLDASEEVWAFFARFRLHSAEDALEEEEEERRQRRPNGEGHEP